MLNTDNKRIQIDALNKAGQFQEKRKDRAADLYKHKKGLDHSGYESDVQRMHEQEMQANQPAPQPKEKPTK